MVASRSLEDLAGRRAELNDLFDNAPADQRHLISRLRTGDQLPFDNTGTVLEEALSTHNDRRDWILTRWPRVVEHAEIERELSGSTESRELASQATEPEPPGLDMW